MGPKWHSAGSLFLARSQWVEHNIILLCFPECLLSPQPTNQPRPRPALSAAGIRLCPWWLVADQVAFASYSSGATNYIVRLSLGLGWGSIVLPAVDWPLADRRLESKQAGAWKNGSDPMWLELSPINLPRPYLARHSLFDTAVDYIRYWTVVWHMIIQPFRSDMVQY